MMAERRLIDASALMEAFRACLAEKFDLKKCVSAANCEACDRGCLWREVVSAAPTIDAVEIVRCKDCMHFPEGMAVGMCKRIPDRPIIPVMYDDFCRRGERRNTT